MAGKINISRGEHDVNAANYPQTDATPQVNDKADPTDTDQPKVQVENEQVAEGIEVVGANELRERAALDAFMEEKVTIRLAKVKGTKPEDLVSPCVNGRYQHLFRGVPQVVARKYVEVLFRSHETSYDYEKETSIMEGDMPVPTSAPSHPFEIIEDTPRGRAWFHKLVSGQL